MKKQLKSILKTKVRNRKVKFINDTKDVVVFFDEELYKLKEELEKKIKNPDYKYEYKKQELSDDVKSDIDFMNDFEHLTEIGRDSNKYNL